MKKIRNNQGNWNVDLIFDNIKNIINALYMLLVTCLCSGKGKNPHIITNAFTEEMV